MPRLHGFYSSHLAGGAASPEGLEIQLLDLGGHSLRYNLLPIDLGTAETVTHGAEENHVHALGIAQLQSHIAGRDGDGLEVLLHGFDAALRILLLPGGDGGGLDGIVVYDGHAGGL